LQPDGSELERLLAENTLACEILGWEPTIPLEEGLLRTIEWMRLNLARFSPVSMLFEPNEELIVSR
jgi:nucleoside-diphosphate-sugar epimerase